ncbi:MAG: hypothetical protein ACI91R_001503 [Vicingaceae bacterium]|jgi:hypothetical protein
MLGQNTPIICLLQIEALWALIGIFELKNNFDSFLQPKLAMYFFGPEYNVDVANNALMGHPNIQSVIAELKQTTERGEPHTGIVLIGHMDLDSGLFLCALQSNPSSPSMASFYISSGHRYFGGQSLVCVPLQFLTPFVTFEGEHIVYRHTFKKPIISSSEYNRVMSSGTDEKNMKMVLFCKSREGFETIPGKSYVGLSKRSWNERYIEHIDKAIKKQGSTLFHQALLEMEGEKVICVHDVSLFGASKETAVNYEKVLIKKSTLHPLGLNMKVG